MSDTKITRILMNMATVEDGMAKGHEAKAKLLRELAAEIDFQPSQQNPEPSKPSDKTSTTIPTMDCENELAEALSKWLNSVPGITVRVI